MVNGIDKFRDKFKGFEDNMTMFIEQIETEPVDLKNLKINISKAELLNTIKKVYTVSK